MDQEHKGGEGLKPFIVAEIGTHAHGDFELAKEYIQAAKINGANAVKFQLYSADGLTVLNSPSYWDSGGKTQHEVFSAQKHFSEADHGRIFDFCNSIGIEYFATPFSVGAVDLLYDWVGVRRFKIASADITFEPLIVACAKKEVPLILSTGASTIQEIQRAVDWAMQAGCRDLTLLHCSLAYPTPPEYANLNRIRLLRRCFPGFKIGYSCHCPDINAAIMAAIMGADMIEKHFTLIKSLPGEDHFHSMCPDELHRLSLTFHSDGDLLGIEETLYSDVEIPARANARRSIVAARNIRNGEKLSHSTIAYKRPGIGLAPYEHPFVVGRIACRDIMKDEPILYTDIRIELSPDFGRG